MKSSFCNHVRRVLAFLAVFALTESAIAQIATHPIPTGREAVAVNSGYRLAAHDTVKITVFGEEELTTMAQVGEDGTIQFPLIKTARVGGKTVREAAVTIEEALKRDYFVSPQVSVQIAEYSKRRFSIMGQIKSPGTYELPANARVDLIQAVAMAGGYTRSANPSKILVKRTVNGVEDTIRVNGKELTKLSASKSFPILSGDTIIVEESLF